jgi:hypothetical protein
MIGLKTRAVDAKAVMAGGRYGEKEEQETYEESEAESW